MIEKHEIDILDIPIAVITEEYLSYIKDSQWLNVEQASEFLVVAATLMQIKAKMLVPAVPEEEDTVQADEEDPRQELVKKLLEYKFYKEISMVLREKEETQNKVYYRNNGIFWDREMGPAPSPLAGITVEQLYQMFSAVLDSFEEEAIFNVLIPRKERSIRQRMREIMDQIARRQKISFHDLFMDGPITRQSVITFFLAMLELLRLHKILVIQEKVFGEITMTMFPGEGEKIESDIGPGNN